MWDFNFTVRSFREEMRCVFLNLLYLTIVSITLQHKTNRLVENIPEVYRSNATLSLEILSTQ